MKILLNILKLIKNQKKAKLLININLFIDNKFKIMIIIL
jgi:hypothetical protein